MNVGERVGDYEVVEVLGAGGMGQVYKVRSVLSDRVEDMKVLLPNLGGDTVLADRFLREIKVQATLDHPNIARLNSAQQVGNQLIMLMEYVEGSTLYALLHKGRMELSDVLQCTAQVLDALAYAHAHGVIHRDIKPANIMRTPAGVVKLMDFGIARMHADRQLTRTGMTVGSLYYMPPEQINGGQPDLRSDLYSLGVTLYEMVTGRRPFVGDSDYSIMAAHLQTTPVAPMEIISGVPLDLNDIIMMAISREPERRFQSADAFHTALRNFAASIGVTLMELPGARIAPAPPPPGNTKTVVMPPMPPKTATPAPPSAARPSAPSAAPPPAPAPSAPAPSATILPPTATGIAVLAPERPPVAPVPPAPVFQAAAGPPIPQVQVGATALPDQPVPARSGSRRGLYMALGSVATLLVLAAAIIEGPKFLHSGASNAATPVAAPAVAKPADTKPIDTMPTPVAQPPAQSSAQPAAAPAPPAQSSAQPAAVGSTPSPVPPPASSAPVQTVVPSQAPPAQPRAVARPAQRPPAQATSAPATPAPSTPAPATSAPPTPAAQQPPAAQPPPPQQPARPSAAELNELRQQYNQVAIRVGAAKSGLRALQRQMQRQGLDIRGDMLEAESRMDYQMQESMGSIRSGDADSARNSLQMAERALETIEKFLGR